MEGPSRQKQAACLICRRSKIKCDFSPVDSRCKRCVQLDVECVRPAFQPGRQKGVKNKRVGLDKALQQIEEAVKRTKSGRGQSPNGDRVVRHLRELLTGNTLADELESPVSFRGHHSTSGVQEEEPSDADENADASPKSSVPDLIQRTGDSLAIDDAENPLQLLARASSHLRPTLKSRIGQSAAPPSLSMSRNDTRDEDSSLPRFLSPARVRLDNGCDIDPIDIGLVTEDEAESLFMFFHTRLAHTRWGLDPNIYTMPFTRSRSAFLLTSVMAAAALFMPSSAALARRLFNHSKELATRVMMYKHKSVEIVLAFMVNVPWMFPGDHSTDDNTSEYVSIATAIAIDLSLHKVVVPLEILGRDGQVPGTLLARADCIDPKTALEIDGYGDLDPLSEKGRRLLRSRERCWLSLFVLERGMSLARGRPYTFPVTRLIKDCDTWHKAEYADGQDGHLVSVAALRRDLDGLFATIRGLCDTSQSCTSGGSSTVQSIQTVIERFFDEWHKKWHASIGTGPQHRPCLPPYVEILVSHTRLSTYGGVINHPTAPLEVRRFFRTAGLSSALHVMRAAVQGEPQLQSMPNNTAIMISFAACFALTLSSYTPGRSSLAPSIRNLIGETADLLERIGRVTEHRNGQSTAYGQQLRRIVRRAAAGEHDPGDPLEAAPDITMSVEAAPVTRSVGFNMEPQQSWSEMLKFSAMSDDQIAQVLNQPGNEFDAAFEGLSWDDMTNFDWLHWPEF